MSQAGKDTQIRQRKPSEKVMGLTGQILPNKGLLNQQTLEPTSLGIDLNISDISSVAKDQQKQPGKPPKRTRIVLLPAGVVEDRVNSSSEDQNQDYDDDADKGKANKKVSERVLLEHGGDPLA